MKQILLLTGILFFSCALFSQQAKIDSLKNVLRTSHTDTIKLKTYYALTSIYSNLDIETAKEYLDTMMQLSRLKKLKKYELTGYSQAGVIEFRKGNISGAIEIWKEALDDNEIDQYLIQKGNYYNNIAVGYKALKMNDSVVQYFLKSIKLNEELENITGQVANYFSISDFYYSLDNFDKSIFYLEKLQKLALSTNDLQALARTYILLANISRKEYDFSASIDYFTNALDYYKTNEPSNLIMIRGLTYEITKVKLREKKYEEAVFELVKLKNDYKNLDDNNDLFWLQVNLDLLISYNHSKLINEGKPIYLEIKNSTIEVNKNIEIIKNLVLSHYEILSNLINNETLNRLTKALKDSKELNDIENQFYSNKYLTLYFLKRNNNKALEYIEQAEVFQDSLNFNRSRAINLSLKRKFNEELKEKENLALKQQYTQQTLLTEKEKTQKWVIGGGLAVSLAGLGIFFIAFNKNKKQKRKIEKQKNEIEKLQRELHHRLKNNLAFIDFFITLAKGKFPDPAYRQKLDELQNRINSMFEVHKQLFKKEDITSVNAKTYISALVDNVKKAYASETIAIHETVANMDLKAAISFPIGLIVNEFVTNSFKYAFPNTENGSIYIELNEDANNYKLKLSDNGKGLPEDFDINTLTSFGMETIKLLTEEYKGTFNLDGTNGTRMDITFPKNAA